MTGLYIPVVMAATAFSMGVWGYAPYVVAWYRRQSDEMLERDLAAARMGMVRGRGAPPRNAVLERHLGPERYKETFMGFGRETDDERIEMVNMVTPAKAPMLRSMEQRVLDTPVSEWVREAEEAEEARYRAQHGPENAPPRPAWPVKWCDGGGGHWEPLGTAHSHGPPEWAQKVLADYTEIRHPEVPRSDFLALLSERQGIPLAELEAYAARANWFAPPPPQKPPPPTRDPGEYHRV